MKRINDGITRGPEYNQQVLTVMTAEKETNVHFNYFCCILILSATML